MFHFIYLSKKFYLLMFCFPLLHKLKRMLKEFCESSSVFSVNEDTVLSVVPEWF